MSNLKMRRFRIFYILNEELLSNVIDVEEVKFTEQGVLFFDYCEDG